MTVKKRKSSGKSSKRKTNRRRKPKVALSTKAVITLSAIIIALSVVFLAISAISNPSPNVDSVRAEGSSSSQDAEMKQSAVSSSQSSGQSEVSAKSSSVSDFQSSGNRNDSLQGAVSSSKQSSQSSGASESSNSTPSNKTSPSSSSGSSGTANSSSSVQKTVSKFNIPQAQNGATLCIVIDDAGMNVSNVKKYAELPFPLTIAVLPKLNGSKSSAYVVRSNGKELILHQPMQALNLNMNPGPGAILPDMTTSEIAMTVKENLDEIGPGVKGLNNHEGSLITENEIKIGAVLEVAMERDIYFLDSRTTAQTKAPQAALERDMEIYARDVFLDDIVSRENMLNEFYRAISIANKNGKVIMIGHVDKSVNILPDLLMELYPELIEKGYKFATPSTLN